MEFNSLKEIIKNNSLNVKKKKKRFKKHNLTLSNILLNFGNEINIKNKRFRNILKYIKENKDNELGIYTNRNNIILELNKQNK